MQNQLVNKQKSNSLNEWKPFKTLKYPGNIVKSLPSMTEQQISLNLIELNLISYYNNEVLELLNEKMKHSSFYLTNRHMLQNLINLNRNNELNNKIKQIRDKYDETYVNGKQNLEKQQQQVKTNDSIEELKDQSQTVNQDEPSLNTQKQFIRINRQKQYRAKLLLRKEDFILALSQISQKLFDCKQGKSQEEISGNKKALFIQQMMEINRKIQQEQEIKSSTSTDSNENTQHQEMSFASTKGYTLFFNNQYHEVKEIFLQGSRYINTKNRNPLVLDFGFSRFIYKNDDQLAHQLIAMELIRYLNKIFGKKYIQQYQIIPEIKGALYEYVEDSVTIASIKQQYKSLQDYFKYLIENKEKNKQQLIKKFVESYAGYCVAEFLLDIKDRNNANIMIKSDGTFFHIDLGFIFAAKPGGISFESAPFKMTKQYIKAMGGFGSDTFKYFETLLIQLLTKVYESKEEFLWKLQILSARSRDIKCFNGFDFNRYANEKMIKNLEKIKQFVEDLIDKSYDNWKTKKYDSYQFKVNKIPI